MWFSLFSTVLILAITFYQGLQGLFTGLINCILAIISAALAFGLYESVYFSFLAERQPEFGRAVALVGIFVVSLLILRVIFDALIKGNVTFHVYVDRAGGGIFGFITAMILVGVLSVGFQMLPFPPDFMGFSRFRMVNAETNQEIAWANSDKKAQDPFPAASMDFSKVHLVRQSTWLNAGGFAASLASHLSTNALRGSDEATFQQVHPDFTAEIFHAKANPLGPSRLTAKTNSIDVVGYWDMPPGALFAREVKDDSSGKKRVKLNKGDPPDSGLKDLVVRVKVQDAKDEGSSDVRFTPDQVRLFVHDGAAGSMKPYTLTAINDDVPAAQNKLVQVYHGEPIARPDGTEMDFVFRIPDKPDASPVYLEFKQDALAEITPAQFNKTPKFPIGYKPGKSVKPAPKPEVSADSGDQNTGGSAPNTIRAQKPGEADPTYGRTAVLGPLQGLSVTDLLPFDPGKPITEYGGQNEISSGIIKGARNLAIPLDKDWQPVPGNMPPLQKFEVASDKRLVQISVERLQPGSYLGRAKSFAIENIEDFYLNDARGNQYLPVGMYALADVHGKKTFELVFLNAEGEQGFAKLPKLNHIHRDDMKEGAQYALVYMFIVPPGTKLKEVHTGGHPVDLSKFADAVK